MARRNPSLLDVLARAPWPVGLIAGVAVLIAAQVLPTVLGNLQNPYLAAIGRQFASGALNPLFWVLAGLCWLAALISFVGQKKRQYLLEAQSGLDTLRAMSWRELEQLVSEAYRRQGYQVQETGQGGADGGIDLVLRRDGQVTLVQCKHWRTQRVGAPVVREQFGLQTHHQAAAVIIVTTGDFTPEAKSFAEGKPIELMAGPELLALVQSVQRQSLSGTAPTVATATSTPPPAVATFSSFQHGAGCGLDKERNRTTSRSWSERSATTFCPTAILASSIARHAPSSPGAGSSIGAMRRSRIATRFDETGSS